MSEWTLLAVLFTPLVAAILLFRVPAGQARALGVAGSLVALFFAVVAFAEAAHPLALSASWLDAAGLNFSLSVDGVSGSLVGLNCLVTALALVAMPAAAPRARLQVGLLLVTETATSGALIARDLVLFFVFWELALLPIFILIAVFGEGRRGYAALKLIIYTSCGSLAMLLAIITLYVAGGASSFSFAHLAGVRPGGGALLGGLGVADLTFLGFALAFAIKTPLFPLHGWLADAYRAAPTPVVMVLAGVVSKLGPYGFYRVALGLMPATMQRWSPLLMTLGAIGIVYGALMALRQDDVKLAIAYISLSHMGFITLGIVGLTQAGVSGALVQMFNHGVLIAALFYVSGHVEAVKGTRSLARISGMARGAPGLAALFLVVALGTLGLPGLNGFVGEYMILLGTFTRSWLLLGLAAGGVVLAAWYSLRLYQGLMNGPPGEDSGQRVDLTTAGAWVLVPLVALVIVIGVYPAPLLNLLAAEAGRLLAVL